MTWTDRTDEMNCFFSTGGMIWIGNLDRNWFLFFIYAERETEQRNGYRFFFFSFSGAEFLKFFFSSSFLFPSTHVELFSSACSSTSMIDRPRPSLLPTFDAHYWEHLLSFYESDPTWTVQVSLHPLPEMKREKKKRGKGTSPVHTTILISPLSFPLYRSFLHFSTCDLFFNHIFTTFPRWWIVDWFWLIFLWN